ncbi:MATH domain and coiled-coil domain-containing protein At3g58270-like [Malus sylvestris]|uniref:MATH domain and coiled-coil domain-containing protein At3g58270-like n=1 Tax=Malus sylvestris TaxID=3752 RepID=UPI0021AC5F00|nr:MATH domain and coiled-coil domain-containing protein At3g58270-like [Malus sylvestris]
MENQQQVAGELVTKSFTWTIENVSKLKTQKLYSEVFLVGDWKWRILVFPKGNNVKQLSLYLEVVDASDLPFLWTRYAQFSFTVVNQRSSNMSITKETEHEFNASESDWGFTSFMPLNEFVDGKKFVRNDKCIIEARVAVRKVDIKNFEDQGTGSSAPKEPSKQEARVPKPLSLDSVQVPHSSVPVTTPTSEQVQANVKLEQVLSFQDAPRTGEVCTKPTDIPVDPSIVKGLEEVLSTTDGKLMDFRGLGKIERAFVPLLEEVCSLHPSLIECQKKRSRTYIEWAFTALGRVLHFLKTTKVKDMTLDTCERVQLLWEELETFKFDLCWLEPYVQSALDVKKLVERAGVVKKQRDGVDALEMEVKRLRARLAVAELDLEVAKRDLAKVDEGFGETDMNRELGYGRH